MFSMSAEGYIALVDDEPAITRLLTFLIERSLRVPTRTFNDSVEALQVLPADMANVWLVICDLRMPEVDGLQLCRHLRAVSPHCPILLLTAYASEAMEAEARAIGINDVVQKPFDPPEFLAKLRTLMEEGERTSSNKSVPPSD